MHLATFRPSVPAGAQIALGPEQSAALAHASEAHTLVGTMAAPPQKGSTGPATHLAVRASAVQSDDDSGSLKVFVAEAAVEAAQDVIEPPTDPDERIAEP